MLSHVYFFVLLPPCDPLVCLYFHSSIHSSIRPSSHGQEPEEEEDGHEQEEGVLPVVIAVVEVTVALGITCILVYGQRRGKVKFVTFGQTGENPTPLGFELHVSTQLLHYNQVYLCQN